MKLNYADLISPYPFYLSHVGGIKSPTLREIWHPDVTYQTYQAYLTLLLMTPQHYCEQVNHSKAAWYQALPDETKQNINMMDMIAMDINLQHSYSIMFNFFFAENVRWNSEQQLFCTYRPDSEETQENVCGFIHKNIYVDLCDIILQRCGVSRTDTGTDTAKVKSPRAQNILKKLQKGRQKTSNHSNQDKDINLPNLITAVATKSNSINFTNIWDLTIYQLYEQFKREQANVFFDIQKMSVAAYGNEKNTFKGNEWYRNEN